MRTDGTIGLRSLFEEAMARAMACVEVGECAVRHMLHKRTIDILRKVVRSHQALLHTFSLDLIVYHKKPQYLCVLVVKTLSNYVGSKEARSEVTRHSQMQG